MSSYEDFYHFYQRYLQHPSLRLPPITQQLPADSLQEMFRGPASVPDETGAVDETLEPKGKAWSNKNLTEYITRAEARVSEFWQALKEVYNMYYGNQGIDVAPDEGLKILQHCDLILSWKMQPGGNFEFDFPFSCVPLTHGRTHRGCSRGSYPPYRCDACLTIRIYLFYQHA